MPDMESDDAFWERFRTFLCKEYCSKYAQDNFRYARQFYKCLLNNDLAVLKTLSTNKRLHVMNALSALSKFVGIYDRFRMLIKAFGLKWSINTDDVIIARLLKYSGNGQVVENKLAEWIRTIKREIPEFAVFMDFILAAGLRFDEALKSYNLIIELARKGKINEYYNAERQMLEHFRFRSLFVRRTKKAFMSFACADLVNHVAESMPLTRDVIVKRLQRKRIMNDSSKTLVILFTFNPILTEELYFTLSTMISIRKFHNHFPIPSIDR